MSMSIQIVGVRPPDARWEQMKAIYENCISAGIELPEAVEEFFDGYAPDPNGVVIEIEGRPWRDKWRDGIEIDVADIPADVKIIRFVMSS